MMSYPSFVISDWLVPAKWKRLQRLLVVAAVGGLAMTAWDLIMDPVMVASGNWGLGYPGRLLWHSLAEFLGLVADGFHHLCAVLVVVWQGSQARHGQVRPAGAGELSGDLSWDCNCGVDQ